MGKNRQKEIIDCLVEAYFMEMETVMSYIAASTNLDGMKAEPIKEALSLDVAAELAHAQALAKRVHELGGTVPGSLDFKPRAKSLQPTEDSMDILAVIDGVIDGEDRAVKQYKKIIRLCEGDDYVTQEMCIGLLGQEEAHLREFVGFRKEFEGKK